MIYITKYRFAVCMSTCMFVYLITPIADSALTAHRVSDSLLLQLSIAFNGIYSLEFVASGLTIPILNYCFYFIYSLNKPLMPSTGPHLILTETKLITFTKDFGLLSHPVLPLYNRLQELKCAESFMAKI